MIQAFLRSAFRRFLYSKGAASRCAAILICCVLTCGAHKGVSAQIVQPSPQSSSPQTSATPRQTPTPTATPLPSAAEAVQEAASPQASPTPSPKPISALFTLTQPRPVPPLPSLVRLGVASDQMLTISLNDAIRRALEGNNQIEVSRTNVRLAEATLDSLEGIYQPVFTITPQISNQAQPLTNVSDVAVGGNLTSISTTSFTIAPGVSKQFRRGGGRYDFSFNNSRTTSNFNSLSTSYNSGFGVNLTQPLLRDRAIDSFRRDIRIQRKRLEQSDADFRLQVIDIIAQVQNAYWELVFALRDQQNRIANVNLARENFRLTEARVAAGSAAPIARAEVQTELSTRETELLIASQNVSLAENNLKSLMLRNTQDAAWQSQIVPTDEPELDTTDAPVSLEAALAAASANRPELRRLRVQQEINEIDVKFFRNQTRPRVDLQANVSTAGLAGTPVINNNFGVIPTLPPGTPAGQIPLIFGNPQTNSNAFLLDQLNQLRAQLNGINGLQLAPVNSPFITPQTSRVPDNLNGGFGRSFRNIFNFDNRNIIVGVRVELPFRNQTAQANLAGARISREQIDAQTRLQEQIVLAEVRNAAQAVETARRRVLTARTARESAELQLEGERRLFEAGRSTQFLLFQRENALAAARNLELRAETDYNQAQANLQRATSTTLQANNVTVEMPQ